MWWQVHGKKPFGPIPAGAGRKHATMTNLIQLRTSKCWGLTENDEADIKRSVDKWKAGSGWPGEESKGGGQWKEKEGKAVIDCTACVLVVRRMRRGGRVTCEEWRAGFALRAAVRALCPLRTHQLASNELSFGHTEHLTDIHNQLPLLTPYPTHPPQINTTMHPVLIEIQKQALTPQAKTVMGRRGVAVVAH